MGSFWPNLSSICADIGFILSNYIQAKDVLGSGEFHGFAYILRIKEKSWNPPYISHLGWYLGSLWHHF